MAQGERGQDSHKPDTLPTRKSREPRLRLGFRGSSRVLMLHSRFRKGHGNSKRGSGGQFECRSIRARRFLEAKLIYSRCTGQQSTICANLTDPNWDHGLRCCMQDESPKNRKGSDRNRKVSSCVKCSVAYTVPREGCSRYADVSVIQHDRAARSMNYRPLSGSVAPFARNSQSSASIPRRPGVISSSCRSCSGAVSKCWRMDRGGRA
jgi:hypothetical protein